MSEVSALSYKTGIYLSTGDLVHGNVTLINEIFVPEYQLIVNQAEQLNVFKADHPRNKIDRGIGDDMTTERTETKNIKLPKPVVDKLIRIAEINKLKEEVKDDLSGFLDGEFYL